MTLRKPFTVVLIAWLLWNFRAIDAQPWLGSLGLFHTFDECEGAREEDMRRWFAPEATVRQWESSTTAMIGWIMERPEGRIYWRCVERPSMIGDLTVGTEWG